MHHPPTTLEPFCGNYRAWLHGLSGERAVANPSANASGRAAREQPASGRRYAAGISVSLLGRGTTIAQQAVVDVLGKPFPGPMRELVLDPLQLADSTFEQPLPTSMATRVALGHRWSFEQAPGGWHVYPEMAAAGLWTNAGDLARLGSDLLRALRGEKSALGLTRATVLSMLLLQLPDQKIGEPFYGLDWSCDNRDDHFHFGHGGWNEGFVAELRLLPALGKEPS
jgi:CubicO group peptidase (beta-lactamase class C family)